MIICMNNIHFMFKCTFYVIFWIFKYPVKPVLTDKSNLKFHLWIVFSSLKFSLSGKILTRSVLCKTGADEFFGRDQVKFKFKSLRYDFLVVLRHPGKRRRSSVEIYREILPDVWTVPSSEWVLVPQNLSR